MFVKIKSFGPDEYGEWKAEAKTDGAMSIGYGPTEQDAVDDSRELMAMYWQIPVDEVIAEGGVVREELRR